MKLSEKIENGKRQLADYLNKANEKFSVQTRKRIFTVVGVLMGCICLAMIVEPFRNPSAANELVSHDSKIPVVIVPPAKQEQLITKEEFTMLDEFKQMMDSLNIYDPNSYKEILKGRESLMDSINFLIKFYR